MNALLHGDFIKAQARRQRRLENRSLPGPKKHHYKEPEPLACAPVILMLVHCRAVEGCRYRLLASHLTLEAVAAPPGVVFSAPTCLLSGKYVLDVYYCANSRLQRFSFRNGVNRS
jgi:hypothetical protein